MSEASSNKLILALLALGGAGIGYFVTLPVVVSLIVFLFLLTVVMQGFSTAPVSEILRRSLSAMRHLTGWQPGAWSVRAPWIRLSSGAVVRIGQDQIVAWGGA
jgi:hypothetical protein